ERLDKERAALQRSGSESAASKLRATAESLGAARVVAQNVGDADLNQLRALADRVREGIGTGVVILGGSREGKAALLVTVTKDLGPRVSADAVIKAVQGVFEAKGGGRPESASAGGGSPARLGDAVAADDVRAYHVKTPFDREESGTPIVRAEADRAVREAREEAAHAAQTAVADDPALRGVATARMTDEVAALVLDGRELDSVEGYHGRALEVHTDVAVAPLVLSGAALATVAVRRRP